MVHDNIRHSKSIDIWLKLINKRSQEYGRTHNLLYVFEVAVLIVGDIGVVAKERDIIVEGWNGK